MQKCFASRVDDSRVWSRSWNGDHPPDHRRVLRGEPVLPLVNSSAPPFGWDSIKLLVVEVWIRACESIPGRSLVDTNPVGELNQTPAMECQCRHPKERKSMARNATRGDSRPARKDRASCLSVESTRFFERCATSRFYSLLLITIGCRASG